MIIVNLDIMMARRKISLGELAEKIDITPANLSILKTGKAKAVRFSTLEAICKILDCQPGDILEYREGKGNDSFPFLYLECQRIHTHLLHHRQQSVAAGGREVVSQANLIYEVEVCVQYFFRSVS